MKSSGRKYPRALPRGTLKQSDSEAVQMPSNSHSPLAAIVLCAGQGTRMKSSKAKVLHPVLGRPLGAYAISRALDLGASPVVPVVGFQAAQGKSAPPQAFPRP